MVTGDDADDQILRCVDVRCELRAESSPLTRSLRMDGWMYQV